MTQAMNTRAIESATGTPWQDWLDWLDGIGAADLAHPDIVKRVQREREVSGWWAQGITVAYEQHIGRREPGQDCNGDYQVGVSKTLPGTLDDALARWTELMSGVESFSDIAITRGPDRSSTEKWRYWRCGLADGSRVNVNIHQKTADKAALGIHHEKLESTDQVEHWRAFWKEQVGRL